MPKLSINIFDVSKGGGGGLERNENLTFLMGKIDMCGLAEKCQQFKSMLRTYPGAQSKGNTPR